MKTEELLSIHTIPKEISNSLFEQSEAGMAHTPYKDEIRLLSCVKEGNIEKLLAQVKQMLGSGVFMGEMSVNNLMQHKYAAVSTITLATRYAIQGGLDEHTAYNFSDDFIRDVDQLENPAQVIRKIAEMIIKLTGMVKKNRERIIYSPRVRKCIAYINENITKRLTVKDIAANIGISADYLSSLFKKETGEGLSDYILKQKLEIAQTLIWEGYDIKKICSSLSFCSKSHFVSSFKKQYGVTPGEYAVQMK